MVAHAQSDLARPMEAAIRRAILETVEQMYPGWNYIPGKEREEISLMLVGLARSVRKNFGRGFLADRVTE